MLKKIITITLTIIFFLGTTLSYGRDLLGVYESKEPVTIEGNLPVLITKVTQHMDPKYLEPKGVDKTRHISAHEAFVAYGWLQEIPNTLIMVFNHARLMNFALLRWSHFVEQLPIFQDVSIHTPLGPLVNNHWLIDSPLILDVGGHDLPGNTFPLYWNAFLQNMNQLQNARNMSEALLLALEAEVINKIILPAFEQNPRMNIAAAALDARFPETMTHELKHTEFFNDTNLQQVHMAYFRSIEAEERDKIISKITDSQTYDPHNGFLIVNEWQAYLFSIGAEKQKLGAFLDPHYYKLLNFMEREGFKIRSYKFPNPYSNVYIHPACSNLFTFSKE